jgi:hypothetical protein
MGWERKRGKLHELNALLRGATSTDILTTERAESVPPPGVRYVITLDADTRLPRGAVARLVGTIAHPLNRPRFDSRAGGSPMATPSSSRAHADPPSRARGFALPADFSGSAGIDPYASRCPTSTRTCSARGATPARGSMTSTPSSGAGRSGAREHDAEPRPVRGHVRPGRAGHRRRAVRRIPFALPRVRGSPASLGTRRLAAAAVDPRQRARRWWAAPRRHSRHRALEDGRQPAPDAVRPTDPGHPLAAWTMPIRAGRYCGPRSSSPR